MKTEAQTSVLPTFTADDIRSWAEHLSAQCGRIPGRDLDNGLEAKACLQASVPRERSHRRLHEHLNGERSRPTPETRRPRPGRTC